ncbi:MAG: leucine-rich repeat domain-containing protein [Bacillota bacterium]|nr:leucine-rich repeat domain-containing protein [Bacillota bacterium]
MKKRRLLSIVISLCMVLALMPQMAFAETFTYGDFEYSVSDGKATITRYIGGATEVEIPSTINGNPVTAIGESAFDSCSALESVTFEENPQLKSIGDYAFWSCSSLESITIPSSVTSIGIKAFHGCKFTSINIPGSVKTIGSGAFRCGSLTSITVDPNSSNYSSADGVLFNKDKTELIHYPAGNTRTSYSIPGSVTSIVDNAFRSCQNLESVTFGVNSKLESIGEDAFYSCTSLTSIIIPNNVTVINERTFSECNNLESIFLSDKVSSIGTAVIPATASQVKYSLDTERGEVTITGIELGTDKTGVAIPATICDYPVVAISDASLLEKISSHTCAGGTATCQTKAICGICKKPYGEVDKTNHNLENIPAKDATITETGNIEYWKCLDCGRLFADENGTKEISLADTVIQKLTPETNGDKGQSTKADAEDSAKTGDNTNLAMWIALMLLSGAGITGAALYNRRKRTNE